MRVLRRVTGVAAASALAHVPLRRAGLRRTAELAVAGGRAFVDDVTYFGSRVLRRRRRGIFVTDILSVEIRLQSSRTFARLRDGTLFSAVAGGGLLFVDSATAGALAPLGLGAALLVVGLFAARALDGAGSRQVARPVLVARMREGPDLEVLGATDDDELAFRAWRDRWEEEVLGATAGRPA